MMSKILTFIILCGTASLLSAQSVLDVSLKDICTDKEVLLKNQVSAQGMVVVFFSTRCPYAKHYESRLADIIATYTEEGVAFIIANANSGEKKDRMIAQAAKLNAPYLLDDEKLLSNILRANKSPEVFLLDKSGKTRYRGAIDDNPQVPEDVKSYYLREAIDAFLRKNDLKATEHRPVGCMIR